MNKKNICYLCGSEKSEFIQKGIRNSDEMSIFKCQECDLVYAYPMQTQEELDGYYKENYVPQVSQYSITRKMDTDLQEAQLRCSRLKGLLRPDSEVLEVGSWNGAFLRSAEKEVKQVFGIELDQNYRKWLSTEFHFTMFGSVDEVISSGKRFDYIALFHVLEHVIDPISFLKKLKQLIKPTGSIVIELPNIEDALIKLYKVPNFSKSYYQRAHLFYFSKKTLTNVIQRAGFSPEVIHIQRYDLSNHIRWMLTGERGGQGFYNNVFESDLNQAYSNSLINAGLSDTLWAICKTK